MELRRSGRDEKQGRISRKGGKKKGEERKWVIKIAGKIVLGVEEINEPSRVTVTVLINHSRGGDELLDSDKLSPFGELAFGTYTFRICMISIHSWMDRSFLFDRSNTENIEKKWNVTMMHSTRMIHVREAYIRDNQ